VNTSNPHSNFDFTIPTREEQFLAMSAHKRKKFKTGDDDDNDLDFLQNISAES
jgi:hypothetical protein